MVAKQSNQLYAAHNMIHDEAIGEILETSSMILALPQLIQGTKNDSDLNMQNIVVSDCDTTHVLNRRHHTICADLVVSHDHTFAESLQVANHCSIIYDLFYAWIWLIYMILCTHMPSTMHINRFGDVEMNTHDNIISAIEHNPNLCANLIEQHVDKFDHKICDNNNICAFIDPCNILYANKNHQFQLISGGEFFAKISPTNCLFYTMLDTPIEVNKMLENISMITSSRSLNTVHSCKFTFIFIGEHVVNKFYVHAICITDDTHADLKSNMLGDNSCDLYFSNEMTQSFSACNSEPSMSFPCLSNPPNENTHGQRSAICAHAEHLFSCIGIDFKGHTTKFVHKSRNKNFGIVMNVLSPSFENFDLGMVKLDMINKLCCLHGIFVLPSHKLFAGTQKSNMIFHRGKRKLLIQCFKLTIICGIMKSRGRLFSKGGRMMRTS
jgi:hypothetical protein